MMLAAVKSGAATPEAVRQALATMSYDGLAMSYKSDGHGNMAHSAVILCYDGAGRVPKIAQTYDNIDPSM